MWRVGLAWTVFVLAASPQAATITGRVFDVYHRPVAAARVVTMERQFQDGKLSLRAGSAEAVVDSAGMYRLTVPPGRYTLAVLPPPRALDFAAVFPAYLPDTADFEKAQAIEVRAGALRPFADFLLLEVEPHRISGEVSGIPPSLGTHDFAVALHASSGYTGALRSVPVDLHGRFQMDFVPAGSYELRVSGSRGLHGVTAIRVIAPETTGIQIHLRPAAR